MVIYFGASDLKGWDIMIDMRAVVAARPDWSMLKVRVKTFLAQWLIPVVVMSYTVIAIPVSIGCWFAGTQAVAQANRLNDRVEAKLLTEQSRRIALETAALPALVKETVTTILGTFGNGEVGLDHQRLLPNGLATQQDRLRGSCAFWHSLRLSCWSNGVIISRSSVAEETTVRHNGEAIDCHSFAIKLQAQGIQQIDKLIIYSLYYPTLAYEYELGPVEGSRRKTLMGRSIQNPFCPK